jgi:hypothetical protein
LDPRFVGSKQAESSGFLKAIKINGMTSFREEVKLSAHVIRFYGMLKIP